MIPLNPAQKSKKVTTIKIARRSCVGKEDLGIAVDYARKNAGR